MRSVKMKAPIASLLTLLLLMAAAANSPSALSQSRSLCQHEAVMAVDAFGNCREFSMDMEHSGQRFKGQVAKVLRKAWRAGDVGLTEYDYLIKLPSGEAVNLGNFKALSSYPYKRSLVAESYLYRSLEIDPAEAGGTCCISPALFYKRALVARGEGYCVAYFMIHPFRGTFYDCDGVSKPSGNIGYAPGAVSMRTAKQLACDKFRKATKHSCTGPQAHRLPMKILRTDDGKLYYLTGISHSPKVTTDRPPPQQTSFISGLHLYRIEASDGRTTRIPADMELLRRHRLVK